LQEKNVSSDHGRNGFCEKYASAMAMVRNETLSLQIPASAGTGLIGFTPARFMRGNPEGLPIFGYPGQAGV
jgi:hypothetical protein